MNEFTKNKIAFAVALLAALFTITPIISEIGSWGYEVFTLTLRVNHLYYFLSAVLTLAVYIYGLQFLTERQFRQLRITGDIFYAIALVSPPLYVSVYILTLISEIVARFLQAPGAAEVLANIASGFIGVLATELVRRIVRAFSTKDKQANVENIQREELSIIARARQLFNDGYFDLTVTECFKAIELTLKKALLDKDIPVARTTLRMLMQQAQNQKIISPELFERIDQLRDLRNSIAHQNASVTHVEAEQALNTTDKVLASIESIMGQNFRSQNEANGDNQDKE